MKKVLFSLSLFLFVNAFAQEVESFTLKTAEEYGMNNNGKIKNAILDVEIARKKVWETTAIGLPQVSAEGSFQNLLDIPVSVVDATLFNPMAQPGEITTFELGLPYSTSLTFNVNQLIFDGSYIVGLKFAKFYKQMSETGIERNKDEVKAMVREAYFNVLVAKENLALMDSILISTRELQRENQILYENKFILKEDADQIKLALNRVVVNKQNAERQVDISKNLLKLQMGYDLDKGIELDETLNDILSLVNEGVKGDYKANNNYLLLEDQKRLDEFSLMNEKAGYYPSLGAFFTHSQNAFRDDFDFFNDGPWFPTTVWGLGLQIPITSSGQRVVKVQQAELKIEKDRNNLTDLERSLQFQELQLKAQFQNSLDQVSIEKENVELAKFIYSQALKRKQLSAVSSLVVTQLQNQLLQAEGTYIGSVLQLLGAKIQLDKLYSK